MSKIQLPHDHGQNVRQDFFHQIAGLKKMVPFGGEMC